MTHCIDVAWKMPKIFLVNTVAAARAFYWYNERDPKQACLFARSFYHGICGEVQYLFKPEAVADNATSFFVDKEGFWGLDPLWMVKMAAK